MGLVWCVGAQFRVWCAVRSVRPHKGGSKFEGKGHTMWGTMTGTEDVIVGGLILMAAGGLVLYVGRLIATFLGL